MLRYIINLYVLINKLTYDAEAVLIVTLYIAEIATQPLSTLTLQKGLESLIN